MIGETELIIIVVFAFFLFGPDKLPEAARSLGRLVAYLKKTQSEIGEVVQQEIIDPVQDIKPPKQLDEAPSRRKSFSELKREAQERAAAQNMSSAVQNNGETAARDTQTDDQHEGEDAQIVDVRANEAPAAHSQEHDALVPSDTDEISNIDSSNDRQLQDDSDAIKTSSVLANTLQVTQSISSEKSCTQDLSLDQIEIDVDNPRKTAFALWGVEDKTGESRG